MTTAAIIVAAGRGTRMGSPVPKQWCDLAGRPVVAHACDAFHRAAITPILLVVHPDDIERAQALHMPGVEIVTGGATRAGSVRNALDALAQRGVARVLIHDGARPLLNQTLIARLIAALDRGGPAAAPALPVSDALWHGADRRVTAAVSRAGLFRAQTPQAFDYAAICAAHASHGTNTAADDVEIACAAGLDVEIIDGDESNIKITWPGDLARATRLIGGPQMDVRTGTGYDVHRFATGDALTLCGVTLPFDARLDGHSDADVGMHALTDAIYGALAEGDIGQHFPPSDPRWKGADSRVFLEHAAARVAARGFQITHADVTLICEAPKIGPHADTMRATLARIMGIEAGRVSVKATTSERLGFTGRREGIAALATATLVST